MTAHIKHQNFIDWMKTLGMFLIVYGHIVGSPFNLFNEITQPVYTKQLGVAFFVFITGWSLANDNRPGLRVVYNRLFAIYFYGIFFALLLSFIFIFTKNDINESNYLPFFLGVNVLFNNFPANPTTWYIGTYLHLILFWFFVLRGMNIKLRHLAVAFIVENIVRYALMSSGQDFIAYMLLPNWFTVFLLGMYLHERKDIISKLPVLILIVIWLSMLLGWAFTGNNISFNTLFPFRYMSGDSVESLMLTSLLISTIYVVNTLIFFQIARRLPGNRYIAFFSRNTLIIFIIHMPIIYELMPYLYRHVETEWLEKTLAIIIVFAGTAILSELLQRFINIKSLSNKLWPVFNKVTNAVKLSK